MIDPLSPRTEVMEFLLSRRSRPAKTLKAPYPNSSDLRPILQAAARTPDHGKLEPWRFVVLEAAALSRLGQDVRRRGEKLGIEAEKAEKSALAFEDSGCAVVVISAPVISEKIPEIEQTYSAGAACLALLNASLASGWGANWLSGWPSHDRKFVEECLGLTPSEKVAGIIHIGTEGAVPPERPRPDVAAKTSWIRS